ncbi:MAG TPA: hypothetical protein VIQ24_01405 [Pyrinomonadaceae bacterium]
MNLSKLGITVTSQRDLGSRVEYIFAFPEGDESGSLMSLLEAMEPEQELSIVDPSNGDCHLEARRIRDGHQIKRGCQGVFGAWRTASVAESHAWLLPGALGAAEVCRPGYGASFIVHK